jgi:hypothetical protein
MIAPRRLRVRSFMGAVTRLHDDKRWVVTTVTEFSTTYRRRGRVIQVSWGSKSVYYFRVNAHLEPPPIPPKPPSSLEERQG